ncbi:MAG: hypothetical protein AAF657_00970 [Acidobacteriota bacterium]
MTSQRAVLLASTLALGLALGCRTASPPAPVTGESSPEMAAEETAAASTAAPSAAAPATEPYKNTIKWTTASEVDNFGFDIFRSLSEDGPFERVNAETIEGAGTTDEPTSYQFVDDTIDPHKAYYYYVESISMSGDREQFTPVGRIRPKISPPEAGDSSDDTDREQ